MNTVKPLKSLRREQAAASQRKVLRAARDAFLESGYHGATMADIADRSGLAVQTVSYHFGTKSKLMSALITESVQDAVGGTALLDTPTWKNAAATSTDGPQLIELFVREADPITRAVGPIMDAARAGALTDPQVAEVAAFHEAWRRRDFRRFVEVLERAHGLRRGLDIDRATGIALAVFSPGTYVELQNAPGWTSDDIRDFITDALKRLLLPEAAPQAS